jgi:hypothetical protein
VAVEVLVQTPLLEAVQVVVVLLVVETVKLVVLVGQILVEVQVAAVEAQAVEQVVAV